MRKDNYCLLEATGIFNILSTIIFMQRGQRSVVVTHR